MKFLEATRILSSFDGGTPLPFLLAMSGQPEPLDVFLRAAAATRGLQAQARTLPFNTLTQTFHSAPREGEVEVFLLFPWDLLPEADWRSGLPHPTPDPDALLVSARESASLVAARPNARVLYVDAPIPPLTINAWTATALATHLRGAAEDIGAEVIGRDAVSLENFLAHGSALASHALGEVADRIVKQASEPKSAIGKVLVTDFDNTLWHGVVGEDGIDGLHFQPSGPGYVHYIYQSYLKSLKEHGVLLAAVTKNDPDLAVAPLAKAESVLSADDFVAIIASYHPKSAQLSELAKQLNLGLESFAFIDDNPVEIAEVSEALPAVVALTFPATASDLPALTRVLSGFFHRDTLTAEDRDRTTMYRRRLEGIAPREVEGSDLTSFLSTLGMRLDVRDRSQGDRTRAVQLINKTNQFNLNGIRRSDDEVGQILHEGGHLYTAFLTDKHGAHGEILSCLLDGDGTIRSLVMSCRVFQRRVEHAFMVWLSSVHPGPKHLEFIETERNEPFRSFLNAHEPTHAADQPVLDLDAFANEYKAALTLFHLGGEAAGARTSN